MITTGYIEQVAQRLADDIAEFQANGNAVEIETIDVNNSEITVKTTKKIFTEDISTISMLDAEGSVIYDKDVDLSTTSIEGISFSIPLNVDVRGAE
ncbi:hypothetical protein D7Z54_33605 [Salibacterium salarium]|uniref:Uncharacterized protein n=1 Tax=Salibacterium salarium TaxID=284579 RepID=A0A3R9WLJ8_9BACI|nr:hypothetical protein [Salibacterium salarium]RSL28991.1 hypothetical protein D7Z54_33605 [Salibacterium salarium]